MNEIKQIFLDLDGPLLDGKARHYFCYTKILKENGFEPIGIEQYWEMKRAMGDRRTLLKASGAECIYDLFLTSWLALIETPEALAMDRVQEGAVDCLREFKALGLALTLVTMRKNKPNLEAQLTSTGLRPWLDDVYVCDHANGGVGKADAVRTLLPPGVTAENTLWIGDTEADWAAANSLGCRVLLLSNGLRSEACLKSMAGAVVKPSIMSLQNVPLGRLYVD